jgi:ATP-binding cassette subfamily B protein
VFLYVRSLKEARGWWPHIAVIAASGLAGIPLGLLAPVPFKIVLDHVLGSVPLPAWAHDLLPAGLLTQSALLYVAIGLGLLLAIAALAHNTGDWLLREWVAERMVRRFRGRMFLHALSMSPIDSQRAGSLDQSFRINQDANALQWTAIYGLIPVINALAALVGTLAVT